MTEKNPVELAGQHAANAVAKLKTANEAASAAAAELTSLQNSLNDALDAERIAAENCKPTSKLTEAVRDLQDKIRIHEHRVRRTKLDAEQARIAYVDAEAAVAHALVGEAHTKMASAAFEFESALEVAATSKAKYLGSLEEYRLARKDAKIPDPSQSLNTPNVSRVIYSAVVTRLLRQEIFAGGKDFRGQPLESAADISRDTGHHYFPLIRG